MSGDQTAGPDHTGGTVNADNPWPGLLAFRETDQQYFQGRRSEADELFRLVMRERLVVLFSLSGLGKSSLLQAGLFPLLRREQTFPVYVRLDFSSQRQDLVAQISDAIVQQAAAHQIEAPPPTSGETLWEYFHRDGNHFWTARNRPVTPVLVFDQFEEIFTLGRLDEPRVRATEAFLEQLADLAECRPPAALKARIDAHPDEATAFQFMRHHYKILLGVREDFLADLELLRPRMPSVALTRLRLRRMNGEAALQVVSQPAHLIDRDIAEKVVRFVAADRGDRPLADLEIEPALLSVVCRELNNTRLSLGEPKISDILLKGSQEQVLTDFYERSTADLPSEVRLLVEDRLLTVSGYRDSIALENALAAPGISLASIDRLVERRLVRREDRSGSQRLELTHDLLAKVVRASRDTRRQREQAEKERLALEAAQREQQQALLKAREEAAGNRQRLKRLRLVAALFLILGVAAATAAVWAIRAQQEATRGRERASAAWARASVKEAVELVNRDRPAESLAHFAQALRTAPSSVMARNWAADLLLRRSWWLPRTPLIHTGPVAAAAFHPDGRYVVTASGNDAQMWHPDTGERAGGPLRHQGAVESVAFSSDGRRVVTASGDGFAQVWDWQSGKRVGPPVTHQSLVRFATISPDGRRVVTAKNWTAQVWEADTGAPVAAPLQHEDFVVAAAFTGDGRRLVTASRDATAQVWDTDSGKRLGETLRHGSGVVAAAFSADGRRVVTGSFDNTARVWDVETGKAVSPPLKHDGTVWYAAFSGDGRRVVTASFDNTARVWDAETGKPIGPALQHKNLVKVAAFSPDGRRVVTGSDDRTAQVWNADTGHAIGLPLRHEAEVVSAAFSADGSRVLTASHDATAQVWDADTGKPSHVTLHHEELVRSAQFSPDGRRVLTASHDGTAQMWDAQDGSRVFPALRSKTGVASAMISRDGTRLVTASSETAQVWEAQTGKPIGPPLQLKGQGKSAAFSANGKLVVTASDVTAQVWDAASGQPVGPALLHKKTITSAEFDPAGHRVVVASYDGVAQVWDAQTGKPVGSPLQHTGPVFTAVFSPDGRRVVTASQDMTAQVWEAETGKATGPPLRHRAAVRSAAFSPDGRRIVTSSDDESAQMWDTESGRPVGSPLKTTGTIWFAMVSADGRRVVTASPGAHTAQVWDAETGNSVGMPLVHKDGVWTAMFSADGRRVVTASSDRTAVVWDVLVDDGSTEDTALLADLAEAVGGYYENEFGSLVPLSRAEQAQRLDRLRAFATNASGQPDTIAGFLRRLFAIGRTN